MIMIIYLYNLIILKYFFVNKACLLRYWTLDTRRKESQDLLKRHWRNNLKPEQTKRGRVETKPYCQVEVTHRPRRYRMLLNCTTVYIYSFMQAFDLFFFFFLLSVYALLCYSIPEGLTYAFILYCITKEVRMPIQNFSLFFFISTFEWSRCFFPAAWNNSCTFFLPIQPSNLNLCTFIEMFGLPKFIYSEAQHIFFFIGLYK